MGSTESCVLDLIRAITNTQSVYIPNKEYYLCRTLPILSKVIQEMRATFIFM